MRLTCTILVFLALILGLKCEGDPSTTTVPTTKLIMELTTEKPTTEHTTELVTKNHDTIDIEEPKTNLNWGTRGIYGGSYYNDSVENPNYIHYVHGTYQPPTKDYYKNQKYQGEDDGETLDYYLGFGLSKMTDKDFKYNEFHHYYHDLDRNITMNETIPSDNIIACHPNATFLCPENTETVCLMNGTIYCMSKISAVSSCLDNSTMDCVNTTVPCVRRCSEVENNLEEISLPCLATIIVEDVYEDNKGMTIGRVGGTFILVPALDVNDKIFCVSVIVDPLPPANFTNVADMVVTQSTLVLSKFTTIVVSESIITLSTIEPATTFDSTSTTIPPILVPFQSTTRITAPRADSTSLKSIINIFSSENIPYRNQESQKIVYKTKNVYHYPGYYSLPVYSHHPGYIYAPSYHYSSHDTGSTALGFFLGYGLGRLSTPTYSHYSFYDGYRPRYDHYSVHHYYHNKESIPQNQEIPSNAIVGCVGDTTTICPGNTTSLCTSTGTLMCVVSATSTVPCTDNRQVNCIKSTISCVNNTAPECKNSNSTSINIPCVSTAKVYGDVKYINNTIIVEKPVNSTNATSTTAANNNSTINTNDTISTEPKYSTKYPITTTPTPESQTTSVNTTVNVRKRRDTPQNFCVTVVAIPSKTPLSEGDKVLDDAKEIFNNFIESAWGL
ncbi:cell wall protein DAN4 [Asbolus verrucosus]|uniref:Cell wall protein DAN4 n=1 Tax=Asbolus verrucosus TaxID=1661398 RepID=A0A482W419_ASBVE|nr:cell wall protein DAN4 [Asbolus verrucosus]